MYKEFRDHTQDKEEKEESMNMQGKYQVFKVQSIATDIEQFKQ